MKPGDTRRISIIGAGMAGTLLATMLAQRGFDVDLFERYPDPRKEDAPGGCSVNLALGERGRHALRMIDLLDAIDDFTIPMRGRLLHSVDGRINLQPYGKDESEVIYSVHRARLRLCLLEAAERSGRVRLRFNRRLAGIDWENQVASFVDDREGHAGEPVHEHAFEVLIGADGAGSAVRGAMEEATDVGFSEELLETGFKELSIPPGTDGGFLLDPNALHIWPRGGYMMIAMPNADGSFTATLFLPNEGTDRMIWGFTELDSRIRQNAFMEANFGDAVPLIPDLERAFRDNPVGLLGTIRCRNWHLDGRALIIGDAAHAFVPFHGQGVNAAFEDCVELLDCIEQRGPDWADVFSALQGRRRENSDAIAAMALENHDIMRESVRHPDYLRRKALEHELERRHPAHFVARYSLVMFHRIPYYEAFRRGKIQAGILDELMDEAESIDDIDFEHAGRLIAERLQPL